MVELKPKKRRFANFMNQGPSKGCGAGVHLSPWHSFVILFEERMHMFFLIFYGGSECPNKKKRLFLRCLMQYYCMTYPMSRKSNLYDNILQSFLRLRAVCQFQMFLRDSHFFVDPKLLKTSTQIPPEHDRSASAIVKWGSPKQRLGKAQSTGTQTREIQSNPAVPKMFEILDFTKMKVCFMSHQASRALRYCQQSPVPK